MWWFTSNEQSWRRLMTMAVGHTLRSVCPIMSRPFPCRVHAQPPTPTTVIWWIWVRSKLFQDRGFLLDSSSSSQDNRKCPSSPLLATSLIFPFYDRNAWPEHIHLVCFIFTSYRLTGEPFLIFAFFTISMTLTENTQNKKSLNTCIPFKHPAHNNLSRIPRRGVQHLLFV